MSDSSLLEFARMAPTNVAPVITSVQRPSMNAAPAMDTANKFAMAQSQLAEAKQLNDYNAKANPLKLQDLQNEVNSRMNAASDGRKYDAWAKTQATDKSLQAALGMPDDQKEPAWQSAANALEKTQMITPEKAAEIRALPPAQRDAYAADVAATARATNDYMTAYGGKGAGAAGGLTTKDSVDLETQAHKQAMDEHKADSTVDVNARTQELYGQLKDSALNKAPAAKPKPAEAAKPDSGGIGDAVTGALKWLNKAGTPEGTPISAVFGGPAAPDQPAAKPEGSVAKDQQAHSAAIAGQTKWVKAVDPQGAPVERAASFGGDPKDAEAFKRWFNTLAMNTPFVSPKDGKAHYKQSNFPE